MAFSTLSAQQETNRKILEDLQLKKQLLQKGTIPGLSAPLGQMHQTLGSTSEFIQNTGTTVTVPRSVFNPTSSTTLGFFIPQDSHYGNTFIPVLPRLDVSPLNHVTK